MDSIEVEEAKAEQLRKRIAASTGDTLDRQEELLRQLNKEVLMLRIRRLSFLVPGIACFVVVVPDNGSREVDFRRFGLGRFGRPACRRCARGVAV